MTRSLTVVVGILSLGVAAIWVTAGNARTVSQDEGRVGSEPGTVAALHEWDVDVDGEERVNGVASTTVGLEDGGEPGVHVDATLEGDPWVGGAMTATAVITVPALSLLIEEQGGPPVAIRTGVSIPREALTVTWTSPVCDICGELSGDGRIASYEWATSLGVEEPYTVTMGLEGAALTSARGVGFSFWGADATVGGDSFSGSAWRVDIGTGAASPGALQKIH